MIPVKQRVVSKGHGDCMKATIASLLELSYDAVPHFLAFPPGMWFRNLKFFFKANGYDWNGSGYPAKPGRIAVMSNGARKYRVPPREQTPLLFEDSINGFFYASVPSMNFRGVEHAVVMDMDGYCAHDPSPLSLYTGMNIMKGGRVRDWYLFTKLEEGWERTL